MKSGIPFGICHKRYGAGNNQRQAHWLTAVISCDKFYNLIHCLFPDILASFLSCWLFLLVDCLFIVKQVVEVIRADYLELNKSGVIVSALAFMLPLRTFSFWYSFLGVYHRDCTYTSCHKCRCKVHIRRQSEDVSKVATKY